MNRKILTFEILLIATAVIAFTLVFPHLPTRIPTHWNSQMQPDGYGSRWTLFWIGPGMMALVIVLNWILPWLSPKHFDVEGFRATFYRLILIVFMLPTYFFVIMLTQSFYTIHAGRAIMGGVCLLFVLIGNLMGKVRRNFFIGVRTPWTLASERVWHATHRLAAKTMVAGGLIGILLVAFGWEQWSVYAILISALIPVLYSLIYYKQLQKRAELDTALSTPDLSTSE
jgi:uncharacterized membrane protein